MRFRFRPMAQADAEAIADWHYPEPYRFYDWREDPDDLAELLEPAAREGVYFAVEDGAGSLAGFFSFRERGRGTVEIGLGLRPDLTGRGLGGGFLAAGLDEARARFGPDEIVVVLQVAAFNRRAIAVYERAGFAPVRVYPHETNGGVWEFVEMTLKV